MNNENALLVQKRAIRSAQNELLQLLSQFNISNTRTFERIPYIVMEIDAAALELLVTLPQFSSLEEDIPLLPTLSQTIPLIGTDDAWTAGFSGSGQTVAILDTGVDNSHSFFSGRIVSEACYSTTNASSTTLCPNGLDEQIGSGAGVNCSASLSGCDHGTHVAGIAAGAGGSFSGVAKGANIIAIQVFSRFDSALDCFPYSAPCVMSWTSDQILAIERIYALRNTYNIAAVNLSLGGGRYYNTSSCDSANPSMKAAIDTLRSVGIATVISSGNSYYSDSLSAPACISSAISVGATTKSDSVASYSNSASFLTLWAPGSSINSSVPGGYGTKSGTSMAAPHVTGAWAVLKSNRPGASVDQILASLTSTGVSITDSRNGVTKPRIQVEGALCFSLTTSANPGAGGNIGANPSPSCDSNSLYYYNSSVTLTANKASDYYRFTSWSGDASGTTNPVQISMNGVKSVTATFEQSTFGDVPFTHQHWAYIEALYDGGYTAGCSTNPLQYCPDQIMNRGMSAVFMLRGYSGTAYSPPAEPWDTFADDWSPSDISWAEKWAEGMWNEGLTAGCQTNPLMYCPRRELPRVEASVFALRMMHGVNYSPPAASGTLLADMNDVNYWGTKWAEQAYLDGLLPACGSQGGKPLFCPDDLVSRAWGAYMIAKAKNLSLPQ